MRYKYIAIAVQLFWMLSVLNAKDVQKPNIIFILADDQGYQDLGCQGAAGIQTPHIDRMAQEGIRLTSFYVSASCSPTRASLMTGRYPQRYHILGPVNNPTHGLPPGETTMAELLKSQGYECALIGKWHLGLSATMTPISQGFDYFSGLPLSQIERFKSSRHDEYYKRQWRIMDARGRDEVEYDPCEEQFTQRCTTEALAFIERNKNQPFFLYLAQPMVHNEVVASPEFVGKSQKGIYGDACQELDWSVGQVLDKLKALGIDENTIVVYASDNGATLRRNAQVRQTHLGSNLPLRGYKFESWEGGSRVPCIIRWPGHIPAGRVSDEIVSITDFFPTFAALSGAKLPADRPVDGMDLWPFLHGDVAHSGRQLHIYCGRGKSPALRVGPWKIIKNEESTQLFNLQKDPSEVEDVADQNPEIVRQLSDYQTQVNAALNGDKPLPQPPLTGEKNK